MNPLTWQNPEQLFVLRYLKKIFYNSVAELRETLSCLANLYKQILPDKTCIKIYLTDDGCTDGTPEAIHKIYPDVHIIKGDGTLYWNRGMYKAWETASKERQYDYYIWLNDDTFTYPEMISTLLSLPDKMKIKRLLSDRLQMLNIFNRPMADD